MTASNTDLTELLTRLVAIRDSWRDSANLTGEHVPAERQTFRTCADMLSEALDGFDLRGTTVAQPSVMIDSVEAAIAEAERNLGDSFTRGRAMELTLIFVRELIRNDQRASDSTHLIAEPLIGRAIEAGLPKVAATG